MNRDQRTARRVPVDCPARIRSADIGPAFYGTCKDLAVGGLTLHSNFVPRPDEELEVTLMPPGTGGRQPAPMKVHARVRRCHELEAEKCYEIGLEIIKVLS
ncbi:PilZ domain-containing protein [Chitinimonas sp.]|uniref:PilZ domain-containing protein n=1 Tax=Chitinimonas sp. TaxID=1934313 RepID=UPI0035B1A97A